MPQRKKLDSIHAFSSGHLPERGGHKIFFQQFGNPNGKPILVFHGGPGGRSGSKQVKVFDLTHYRVIMFDQRGCGQSTPKGELKNNTLNTTISDAKALLRQLELTKVVVCGGSWGATLALAFSQKHPSLVEKLILMRTFLGRRMDIEWLHQGAARIYADIYPTTKKPLRKQLAELLKGGNSKALHQLAARFLAFEQNVGTLEVPYTSSPPSSDDLKRLSIYLHYDAKNYFLKDNEILKEMKRISHIPALILHNRGDLLCPVDQAILLSRHFKKAKLEIVPALGHNSCLLDETAKKEIPLFLRNRKL